MRRDSKNTLPQMSIFKLVNARRSFRLPAAMIAAALALAGCDSSVIKHGVQFHEGDLQQIQPGMTQEQVRMNLGTPSTTAVVGTSQAYYYISSTATQTAFMLPTEQDRQVVAVYFSQAGTVERIANYGMKDGRVFDYVSRTTPAPGGKDVGIVQQLFRNLGTKQIFGD
ncbi:outer membrane protein assembly factor BamE [Hyphomicrobium sp. 1Nfss2.1]|uniref:outer membrane protein assembly factor BamE n=1 Tax=Hyphomicrobium sp. 1Nfss2.1 TaxID=3413936 RepID=UPI003C7CC6AF